MIKEVNIIICGVGGQGVVLLSELLGAAAVSSGMAVKGSEVLGMAQRGGSVFSNIRLGGEAVAPLTPEGKCDIIVALEPSEALRNMHYLAQNGIVVLNSRTVLPFTVSLGKSGYPSLAATKAQLGKITDRIIILDATALANQAGSRQAANVVMLGALFGSGLMPLAAQYVKDALSARFGRKLAAINSKAFDLGRDYTRKALS